METTKIKLIIVKFLNQEASLNELDILENWLKDKNNHELFDRFVSVEYLTVLSMNEYNVEKAKKEVSLKLKKAKRKKQKVFFKKTTIAAIVLVLFSVPIYLLTNSNSKSSSENNIMVNQPKLPILPGSNKAILRLDDGEEIELDKGKTYSNAYASSSGEVLKYANEHTKDSQETKVKYNMLTIPRGGQHFVVLADGTQVWLNSESQLKYPVSFKKGETRKVELVYGEAYFDVSPSTSHNGDEFKVHQDGQEVQVLGTEFNIKAYKGESNIYTTLVEGKITLSVQGKKQVLAPSQQSNLNTVTNVVTVAEVDVFNEVSWVKGVFSFDGKPLNEILKVLSRWYDVDLVLADTVVEDEEFNGILSKDQNLEDILATIKSFGTITGYEINGKEIMLK
jgi:hypothetical protein